MKFYTSMLSLILVMVTPLLSNIAFEEAQYSSISFYTNGGSLISPREIKVGDRIEIPETTKVGFTFVDWYTDDSFVKPFNLTIMPARDIRVYAKWDADLYTIHFETNGGNSISSIQGYFGDSIPLPNHPTRLGYTFQGWYRDSNYNNYFSLSSFPSMNMTLYAKWLVNQYTITFNTNGGYSIQTQTKNYNASLSSPMPVRVGHSFAGWFTDVALTQAFTLTNMPAQNLTLYAKWRINQYTITFETNGGSSIASITGNYGDPVTAPSNPTREGYTFNGWFANANLTQNTTIPTTIPAQNLTLYAKWTINQYTITFETNGGNLIQSQTLNFNILLNLPTPMKVGQTFVGWFIDIGLTQALTLTNMPATNLTIYAKWNISTYMITWTNFDGTILEIDQNVPFETMPVYNGLDPIQEVNQQYTFGHFIGWLPTVTLVTNNQVYVAQYEMTLNTYTISWNNFDETIILNENYQYGTLPIFNQLTPSRPADEQYTYTFSGWNPTISQVLRDTTYTATFTPVLRTYTVIWKNYDGKILERDFNVSYGTIRSYDGITPRRYMEYNYSWSRWIYYTFVGWSPTDVYIITGDQEFIAIFSGAG